MPDKDLVDLCPPIEPYQVTKNLKTHICSLITDCLLLAQTLINCGQSLDITDVTREKNHR
ncbi:MAG: hypothetical protein LW635_10880 [Microcystis sp. 53598_E5]|uniref:hypothetical protein n=1 Tax=Microcystis sp. M53598_WE2 TaxID=3030677 RepID=UPI00258FCD7C|nr:hypothetical protein [Microcystis sp. M53598_WE2]MCE2674085.1 hypothetical protein [Microcystis sp. 53598_E5]MDJ0527470.1 hypothetical protein [Microcystis sp. M53600_WE12]MDJ0671066.1 hypothetical protein [Microcystis sp. M53598_WE2]